MKKLLFLLMLCIATGAFLCLESCKPKIKLTVEIENIDSLTYDKQGNAFVRGIPVIKNEIIVLKPDGYDTTEVLNAFSAAFNSRNLPITLSLDKNRACEECENAVFIIKGDSLEKYSFTLSPGNGQACQGSGNACASGGAITNSLSLGFIQNDALKNATTIFRTPNSKEILVAILDTGIDSTDTFIKENSERILPGINVVDGSTNIQDSTLADTSVIPTDFSPQRHGTKIAKIILNNTQKDFVKILPIKITNSCPGNLYDAICGIFTAMKHNANVLNLSWNFQATEEISKLTMEVFKQVNNKNILVSTAAGNDSLDITPRHLNRFPACFSDSLKNITGVTTVASKVKRVPGSISIIENYSKQFIKVGIISDENGYFEIPNDRNSKGSSYATAFFTAYICNKLGSVKTYPNPENVIDTP